MAQTKRKRRRKHRGTQAGNVERAARTGSSSKPKTKVEAREAARKQRTDRLDRPPTWRGALTRAGIAATFFGVIVILAFDRSVAQGAILAAFTLLLYIPMSYFTDLFIYRRRQRRRGSAAGGGSRPRG